MRCSDSSHSLYLIRDLNLYTYLYPYPVSGQLWHHTILLIDEMDLYVAGVILMPVAGVDAWTI